MGGLHKVQRSKVRKEKKRVRRKLGERKLPVKEGWKKPKGPLPPTRSVIFMDNTAEGELARRFQKAEEEAGEVTGYRIRITESAGTPMGMLLPSTNPWGPQDCTRKDCVTCNQNDDKRIDCRKRNILYESECVLCQEVKKTEGGREGDSLMDGRGIYVGES